VISQVFAINFRSISVLNSCHKMGFFENFRWRRQERRAADRPDVLLAKEEEKKCTYMSVAIRTQFEVLRHRNGNFQRRWCRHGQIKKKIAYKKYFINIMPSMLCSLLFSFSPLIEAN